MKKVKFVAQVEPPDGGEPVMLTVTVPVGRCWEHRLPEEQDDEDTPPRGVPHVHSTSGYHTDYEVCLPTPEEMKACAPE